MALIADFYGQPVADFAASHALAETLRADVRHYRDRIGAAVATLRAHEVAADVPIGAIGFCMGGQAVLELARDGADLDVVVSFHGILATGRPAQPGDTIRLMATGAQFTLGPLFSLLNVPRVGQVHLFYRATLLSDVFAPGYETMEARLFTEEEVPWDELAFRTVRETLLRYFADRRTGAFGVHCIDVE